MAELGGRREDIDRAKGLAILLVVFGHIVARADPVGVEWYEPLRHAVYAFHMPFFLYLSGMVAVLSGALMKPGMVGARFVAERARRLLVPFFALGAMIVFGKVLAARFMFVDNRPESLGSGLASLVWHTVDSPALSIWYLFVLFVLSVAAPVLVRADGGGVRWLVGVGLVLYCVAMPQYLYLDHIGRYAVFFALGVWAAARGEGWTRFVDRYWGWLLAVLLAVLAMIAGFGAGWPVGAELLPVGALSMPAVHGLVRHLPVRCGSGFHWLGRYSFMIYLFNTIFIGLAKGVVLRFTAWDGAHFLPVAGVLMTSGIMGPILVKRLVLRRVGVLDRVTK
jgi:fucose 4-O-acetylase-like acetyltransferase